jgi:hypothetical protein
MSSPSRQFRPSNSLLRRSATPPQSRPSQLTPGSSPRRRPGLARDVPPVALCQDDHALKILVVRQQLWLIGPDRVNTFDTPTGSPKHRLVLPPGTSPFSGAATIVGETVWLGHANGAIRVVHCDGRGQIGASFRFHNNLVVDLAHCKITGIVASTDSSGTVLTWLGDSRQPNAAFRVAARKPKLVVTSTGGHVVWDSNALAVVPFKTSVDATDLVNETALRGFDGEITTAMSVDTTGELWCTSQNLVVVLLPTGNSLEHLSSFRIDAIAVIEACAACGSSAIFSSGHLCVVVDVVTRSPTRVLTNWQKCSQMVPIGKVWNWRFVGFDAGLCTTVSFDEFPEDSLSSMASPSPIPALEDVREAQRSSSNRRRLLEMLSKVRSALVVVSRKCEVAVSGDGEAPIDALRAADEAHQALLDIAAEVLEPDEISRWLSAD